MKNLLKKNEQRQLNLVEELYHEGASISVASMAERLGFSERSIMLDIEMLQEEYPFLNLTLDNQLISMSIESNYNLNYFYKMLFKKSTVITLLIYLFFEHEVDLEQLANYLERSAATIYRLVQQTNQTILPLHNIEIDTNPFKIIGKENDIRLFFSQLFTDITPAFEWPFEHINEQAVADLISNSLSSLDYSGNYVTQTYLKFMVAVNITRLKQQNLVDIYNKERSAVIFNYLFENKEYIEKTKQISRVLNFKPTQKNLEQIFYMYINSDFILPESASFKSTDPLPNMSQRTASLTRLNQVISTLSTEFGLTLVNTEELVRELHNSVTLKKHDLDAENIIHNYKTTYITRLKEHFPDFTNRALELFSNYCKDMGMEWTEFFKIHLIYQLFIHWQTLYTQLTEKDTRIQAVIICKYDYDHALFLQEYFEVHLGKIIKFKHYDKLKLSLSDLENAKESIIISTFHLPKIEGKHVININFYPTPLDLRRINQTMLNILDANGLNL